jgi:hypothetical protein
MNLSDYINLTITEIAAGSKKADTALKQMGNGGILAKATQFNLEGLSYASGKSGGHIYNRPIIDVAFRVNVELQETEESNGEIKGSLRVISGGITTVGTERQTTTAEVSFSIPMLLPYEK